MTTPSIGAMFLCAAEPELLPSYARMMEASGYQELWLVEDCFFAGGIASMATALAVTSELTVGLGIMPAVMRNPATIAMEIAALDRLHRGRVLPGIGHGVADWMRQIGAFPRSQLAALEEVIVAVRRLLTGETVTIDGEYVNLDAVRLDHPPPSPPPISAGVRGPRSLALAGRVADGTILAEGAAPGYVAWARQRIAEGMAAAGRQGPHRLTVYAFLSIDEDGVEARRAVRPTLAAALCGGSGQQVGPLGISEELAALVERGGEAAVRDGMPDTWVEQLAVAGTPDECVAAIAALGEAGADSVILVPPPDRADRQLAHAAGDILPQLA